MGTQTHAHDVPDGDNGRADDGRQGTEGSRKERHLDAMLVGGLPKLLQVGIAPHPLQMPLRTDPLRHHRAHGPAAPQPWRNAGSGSQQISDKSRIQPLRMTSNGQTLLGATRTRRLPERASSLEPPEPKVVIGLYRGFIPKPGG